LCASVLEKPAATDNGSSDDEEYDEKWDEALAIIADSKQASISMLQRCLRLGYNRAARMIEKMEAEGIVSPSDGTSRPRENGSRQQVGSRSSFHSTIKLSTRV
jgi:S-DNA-T family DNA segregation ATPase FtsK/SpoIIIE